MPAIFETVTINADIESVFDLIARVEEFPLYADALKEVRRIGHDTYWWLARVQGLTLEWDSIISEYRRPNRLAWRSIRGFTNSGAYTLTAFPGGTIVSISIEYSLQSPLLERLTAPIVTRVVRGVAAEILTRVKARLESGHAAAGAERKNAAGIGRLRLPPRTPRSTKHV